MDASDIEALVDFSDTRTDVGGIVIYRSWGSADGEFESKECPAIVTKNHGKDILDLVIFDSTGIQFELAVKHGYEPGKWHCRRGSSWVK